MYQLELIQTSISHNLVDNLNVASHILGCNSETTRQTSKF